MKARNVIKGIVKKREFKPSSKSFTIQDKMYEKLMNHLLSYCKIYNVYPVNTTIEGSIINVNNYEVFLNWILSDSSSYSSKEELKEVYEMNENPFYRVDILKHVVGGKTQLISSLKEEDIHKYIDREMKEGYLKAIGLPKIGKSSGWVTDFLEYYFNGIKSKKNTQFHRSFPELNDIIKTLDIIMK